jgi:predicted enzyme related to lactoylglutathione lyase
MINVGEGTGGGIMKTVQPDSPSYWLSYVLVDDIKTATSKARSLGATICKDVTEIPGMGWISVFTDPTGATLALWQMNPDYRKPAT